MRFGRTPKREKRTEHLIGDASQFVPMLRHDIGKTPQNPTTFYIWEVYNAAKTTVLTLRADGWLYVTGVNAASGFQGNASTATSATTAGSVTNAQAAKESQIIAGRTQHIPKRMAGTTGTAREDQYQFAFGRANNNAIKHAALSSTAHGGAAGIGATPDVGKTLQITYTGQWQYPYVFDTDTQAVIVSGTHGSSSQQNYTAQNLVGVYQFTYGETSIPGYGLQTLSFDNLQFVAGNIAPMFLVNTLLTSMSFPALLYVGGTLTPVITASDSFPLLQVCNGVNIVNYLLGSTTLSLPSLTAIGAAGLTASGTGGGTNLTSMLFPALQTVAGSISFGNMGVLAALPAMAFPSLQYAVGGISITNGIGCCGALQTFSAPALVYVGSQLAITPFSVVVNCTLGTVGVTKCINCSVNVSGQKLTQASVDAILAVLASLDGTNGTTSWGTGKTVNLSGGTNSTPSASGLASKAVIVARGGTVTHN